MDIRTRTFLDGIAFYKNEKELAFYSNVTNMIRFFNESKYWDLELSIEDYEFILQSIKEYVGDEDES